VRTFAASRRVARPGGFVYARPGGRRPGPSLETSMRTLVLLGLSIPTLLPALAQAAEPGAHPYARPHTGRVRTIDVRTTPREERVSAPVVQPDFAALEEVHQGRRPADPDGKQPRTGVPDGFVQRGNVVVPQAIDDGTLVVEPETIFAVEDIPGNEYPRKHTLYLNFSGGMLSSGTDNSALDKSSLALDGNYPAFTQGEAKAVSVVQGVEADFAPYGVRIVYLERPPQVLPYTMAMVSGDWTDVNLDSPAGGVAPGADCGALGQRHVVYAFESSSAVQMANTTSQEAGHAYGLDHVLNCESVMSYCGAGDQNFQTTCAGLCESGCQGPNSAGCQLTHEMFCGEGSFQQNDDAEMAFLFGGNEPDMEAPTAEIVEPADGAMLETGDVELRAIVDDNYGGYGWKFVVVDGAGTAIVDIPDYDREVDAEYRAALNLTGLPEGTYTFRVEVLDHYGLMGMDEITFSVGAGGATSADTGTADSAGTDEGGTDDANDTAADDDGESDGSGESGPGLDDDGTERGCACASAEAPAWSGALVLFAIAAVRRRRAA